MWPTAKILSFLRNEDALLCKHDQCTQEGGDETIFTPSLFLHLAVVLCNEALAVVMGNSVNQCQNSGGKPNEAFQCLCVCVSSSKVAPIFPKCNAAPAQDKSLARSSKINPSRALSMST